MKDDSDKREQLAKIEASLLEAINSLRSVQRELDPPVLEVAVDVASAWPADLIPLAVAAQRARVQKDTVRLWCRKNLIGHNGGFAVKLKKRWHVSSRLFSLYLQKN